jgi:hypothetical protein
MDKIKIELNKQEIATILLSLIANRHRYENALRNGKLDNYKLTNQSKSNIKMDIEKIKKLEKFFDVVNSKF